MIVKAIIEELDSENYKARIRIPIYNKSANSPSATPFEELYVAPICTLPGINPAYKVGDIVFVSFENNEINKPIILGKLFTKNNLSSKSDIYANSFEALLDCILPDNTKLENIDLSNYIFNAINAVNVGSEEQNIINEWDVGKSGTYPRLLKYNDKKIFVFLDDRYKIIENGIVSETKYFSHRVGNDDYNGESDETHTITEIANAFPILSPNNDGRIIVFFRCHGKRKITIDNIEYTIPYYSIRAKVSYINGSFNDYSGPSTVMWSTELDEKTITYSDNQLNCEYNIEGGTLSVWEPWSEKGLNYVVFSRIRHNTTGKSFPLLTSGYPSDTCQDIYKQPYVVNGDTIERRSGLTTSYVIHGYTQKNMDNIVNNKSRVGMISFSQLIDGKHIGIVENSVNLTATSPRPLCVQYLYTNNMTTGTWSPTTLNTILLPNENESRGAPYVTTLEDGRVAISFMSSQEFYGIERTDTKENNRVINLYISKEPVLHGTRLTDESFNKISFFDFEESEWGKWGSINNIDDKLFIAFTCGKNTSTTTSTKYGNIIKIFD